MKKIKIIVVGNNVGKTSLIKQYVERKLPSSYKSTIGADVVTKEILIAGKPTKIKIWDIPGHEKHFPSYDQFYRGADALVIVYSAINRDSFNTAKTYWHDETRAKCPNAPIVLVALNPDQRDPKNDMHITKLEGKTAAKIMCAEFIECSVQKLEEVDKVFVTAIELAIFAKDQSTFQLHHSPTEKSQKNGGNSSFYAQIEAGVRLFRQAQAEFNALSKLNPDLSLALQLSAKAIKYLEMAAKYKEAKQSDESLKLIHSYLCRIQLMLAHHDSCNENKHTEKAFQYIERALTVLSDDNEYALAIKDLIKIQKLEIKKIVLKNTCDFLAKDTCGSRPCVCYLDYVEFLVQYIEFHNFQIDSNKNIILRLIRSLSKKLPSGNKIYERQVLIELLYQMIGINKAYDEDQTFSDPDYYNNEE